MLLMMSDNIVRNM